MKKLILTLAVLAGLCAPARAGIYYELKDNSTFWSMRVGYTGTTPSNYVSISSGAALVQSASSTGSDYVLRVNNQAGTALLAITQAGTLTLPAGSVDTAKLGSGAIDTTKMGFAAVTANILADASVTTAKIVASSVDTTKLNSGAVDTTKVNFAAVTTNALADSSVTTAKIVASAVDTTKLGSGSVDTSKMGRAAVGNVALQSSAVDTAKVATDAISTVKILGGAVTADKIAALAVDTTKIGSGAVDTTKLGFAAVTTNAIADGTITSAKLAASVGASKVVNSAYCHTEASSTGSTGIPFDDTIPQITEGDEYLTCSITPTSGSNNLLVEAQIYIGENANVGNGIIVALFRDSTADALAASFIDADSSGDPFGAFLTFSPVYVATRVSASSTSSTTFRIRAGGDSGLVTRLNGTNGSRKLGGALTSFISILEVAP